MANIKGTLPFRIWRARHDNAVWWWQQQRVKRAIAQAFAAPEPLGLDRAIVIEGGWPDASDPRPVVMAACDDGYFRRFGQHLALSGAARSPATRVHLHLYSPSPVCQAEADALVRRCNGRLTVSHEDAARDPFGRPTSFYFAAGRFAVASRMRREIEAPILMIDADGLVANDLAADFPLLASIEAGFILQPDNAARYRRILASAIYLGVANRTEVERFFTRLADGIGIALAGRGDYHVDQIGIHYALRWCARHQTGPQIADLDIKWSDYRFAPDSLIWSTKGARKGRYEELLAEAERDF